MHLVCRPDGVPVRVQMLPAGMHDLTPVHELAYGLPAGARLLGDKAMMSRKIWCEHRYLRQDGAICQTRKEHTDEHDRRTFWRR